MNRFDLTITESELLVINAHCFAYAAHAAIDHRRKYTDEPYINHPAAVVELVRMASPATPEMLAAAWLHDVVEDTEITLEQIEEAFGEKVRELVWYLSDVSKPEDGPRAVRKAKDRDHIARAGYAAQTVKLADLIDNARDIVVRDPGFAKVYMHEKRELLDVLRKGDPTLWDMAHGIVEAYFKEHPEPYMKRS